MAEEALEYKLNPEKNARVYEVNIEYENYVQADAQSGNRSRMARNFKFYSGVNGGQWDDNALRILNERQQPAHTFNFIQGAVDTIAGNLVQNPVDVEFDAIQNDMYDEVNIMQELYDYDFERGNYNHQLTLFIRDALIHTGVMELIPDYTHDSFGNVGVKTGNPHHYWFDPNWQSDDIKECRGYFKTTWMTAPQIKRTYNTKAQEVDDAIQRNRFMTSTQLQVEKVADRSPEYYNTVNNTYNVVQFVWTEQVEKKKAYDKSTRQFDDSFDAVEFQRMADINFVASMNLQSSSLEMRKEMVTETRVFTYCPGLSNDLILEDGLHPLQLGKLPVIVASAKNVWGQRSGIVDLAVDSQEVINKRESTATHILGTNSNANYLVESDAFGNDPAKIDDFKKKASKGGQVFEVEPGTIRDRKIAPLERHNPPNDLWSASDRALSHLQNILNLVNAIQGKADKANESAILFEAKRNQSLVTLKMLSEVFEQSMNYLGEMYFYAAKHIYAGPERMMKNKKTGSIIEINKFGVMETGEISVMNDIAKLGRHNINVKESPLGLTNRMQGRIQNLEMMRISQNPLAVSRYEKSMLKYLDLPEDERTQMEQDAELFIEFQKKQLLTQNAQMNATLQQLGGQQQQMQQQAEQLPPDAVEIAKSAGFGSIPSGSGIAGSGGSAANNVSANSAPSDQTNR